MASSWVASNRPPPAKPILPARGEESVGGARTGRRHPGYRLAERRPLDHSDATIAQAERQCREGGRRWVRRPEQPEHGERDDLEQRRAEHDGSARPGPAQAKPQGLTEQYAERGEHDHRAAPPGRAQRIGGEIGFELGKGRGEGRRRHHYEYQAPEGRGQGGAGHRIARSHWRGVRRREAPARAAPTARRCRSRRG